MKTKLASLKNILKEFEMIDYNIINEDKNLETLTLEVILMNYKKPKIQSDNDSTLKLILSKLDKIENRLDKIESDIEILKSFHQEDFAKLKAQK